MQPNRRYWLTLLLGINNSVPIYVYLSTLYMFARSFSQHIRNAVVTREITSGNYFEII